MKKSRIILPAIALLAVSGIASVTGTVAWFTASQSAAIKVGNLAAINTSGELKASVHGDHGVKTGNTVAKSDGTSNYYISGTEFQLEYLRDTSYDAINDKYYVGVIDTDSAAGAVNGYREVSNTAQAASIGTGADEKAIWYAAEWDVDFSLAEGTYGEYELFFDARAASSKLSASPTIATSLRIAMICGEEKIVWSPVAAGANTYVTSTTATATYGADTFIAGADTTHYTSSTAKSTATGHVTHLASGITAAAGASVKFVAWFEGTDPTCIANNASNASDTVAAFAADMAFYVVSWTGVTA